MRSLVRFALSLFFASGFLQSVPSSVVGQWKIGSPFVNMAPQPVGLSSKQLKMLVGRRLTIKSMSAMACGKTIQLVSVEEDSADSFLQKYGVRPDQIGLQSAVTELSFTHAEVCGNSEGFQLITDGHDAALEDGNAYFRLSKAIAVP